MFFNRNCCRNNFFAPNNYCCPNPEQEIIEPAINKCIEKEFYHEIKHCCPINTHIINKHIYNHTYTPVYTCSEEDQIINNDCGGCQGLANNM